MTTTQDTPQKLFPPPKKRRRTWLPWLHLTLIAIIVLCLNFVASRDYYRRDLTEDQRFSVSQQTKNLLQSDLISKRETPIKLFFVFQRTTQNYTRMRSLLEEYKYYANNKVVVEYIDPLREPNRAREIALIYKIEFKKNQVIIDARQDTTRAVDSTEGKQEGLEHIRFIDGNGFVVYERQPDGTNRAVALQMEDLITAALIGSVEGTSRKMYILTDKAGAELKEGADSGLVTLRKICLTLNLQLTPLHLSGIDKIPDDAAGLMVIAPQYDFSPTEVEILDEYWQRNNAGVLMMLTPHADSPKALYSFLRGQGVRPSNDRVLLQDRKRAYYQINALFAPQAGLAWMQDFDGTSTGIEGESFSLTIDDTADTGVRMLNYYPLLLTSPEYYGETKYTKLNPQFEESEDNLGPLMLGVAVVRGNSGDVNLRKTTSRMVVLSNTDIIRPSQVKPEQRDFIRAAVSWLTDRESLAGLGSRHDFTIKLNLDRHALSAFELLTNIILPGLTLLIGLAIWNFRRS